MNFLDYVLLLRHAISSSWLCRKVNSTSGKTYNGVPRKKTSFIMSLALIWGLPISNEIGCKSCEAEELLSDNGSPRSNHMLALPVSWIQIGSTEASNGFSTSSIIARMTKLSSQETRRTQSRLMALEQVLSENPTAASFAKVKHDRRQVGH